MTPRLDDVARLDAIRRSELAPNMNDSGLDRHCRVAAAALGAESVMFSVVDADHQFFPSSLGLVEPAASLGQTPLTHSFCQHVVLRNEPIVISDASVDPLVADSLAQQDLGVASYVGVPVRDDEGHVLGALCAMASAPRSWTSEQVATLSDISDSIEAELFLRKTRSALQSRLVAEQMSQEYEHSLSLIATATNRTQTVQGVADELVARISPIVGATLTTIGVLANDELHFTHGSGVDERVAARWLSTPLHTNVPMTRAVANEQAIHLGSLAEFDQYPDFAAANGDLGLRSFRAIPFSDEAVGFFGVLGLGWDHDMDEENVPPGLARIVDVARTALTRAWQFEVERNQARVLERVVLPTTLPDTGVFDIAGAYIAPDIGQRVGGDVYDVLVRSDGCVGVMVADAVGHDLTATRAVARLRHAVGVLVSEGYGPAEIMSAVNRYVSASPSRRLVTCVCLLFAADGSTVTLANAGHPQPLLRSESAVTPIGPVGQPLLGRADVEYTETTLDLEPGDLVLSFTDGVIDRRGHSFIDGEQWLLDFLGDRKSSTPQEMTAALHEAVREWDVDDDMAFLLVGRRETPSETERWRWSGPAASVSLAHLRREAARFVRSACPSADTVDLQLVVTELLTNAREATSPVAEMSIEIATSNATVDITVTNLADDVGDSFAEHPTMPAADSVRGRGLAIVEKLTSSLEVAVSGEQTIVTAVLDLPTS